MVYNTNQSRVQNWAVTASLLSTGYTVGEKGGGSLRDQSKDISLFEYNKAVTISIHFNCTKQILMHTSNMFPRCKHGMKL